MLTNNTSIEEKKKLAATDLKVAVNSIQKTLFVERLYVNIAYPSDRIIPYDKDNLYPQKVKSIAQRSGTTMGAIQKKSEFLSGEGFQQMKQVINREGQTLWDLLRFISFQKSLFGGYALHFNFNYNGVITEINPVNFEFARWSKNLEKMIVNPDWYRRYRRRNEEIEYNLYDPGNVPGEIQQVGNIYDYKGQLYYWIPNLAEYYCVTDWDSVLDDAQFEAEAKLYSLSSIQNDYSLSGIISYPKNITSQKDIDNIKDDIKKDTGAFKAGGVRVVGAMPVENFPSGWKWYTPISRNNIDGLHTKQVERAKFNIYAAFKMPPILCGVATKGMFNQESFMDAFNYYNSATETDRKEIERELNKILKNSIWANLGEIQIQPKIFQGRAK